MPRTISDDERRARLARRHLLHRAGRTDDVAAIADSVVALHSSDPVTVYLSALARMEHPSVQAVEDALYVDRTVFRHHAMRRTLWVARPDVVRLMHAAATRRLVGAGNRPTPPARRPRAPTHREAAGRERRRGPGGLARGPPRPGPGPPARARPDDGTRA